MITRGLKKDSNGKWVWVDDYVIKQEEVSAAVLPSEVPLPVIEKHLAPNNDDQPMLPPPPSVPTQNGHIDTLPNDASPGPIFPAMEPTMTQAAQSVEVAIASAISGEPSEQRSPEISEVSSIFHPLSHSGADTL
jgi:hypothetical protein